MTKQDVTRIKISNNTVGIVGLGQALEAIAASHADQPDSVVAEEMLDRLSKSNYIPRVARKKYARAFVRRFRKFIGQPFEDESPQGVEIRVFGGGCNICDGIEHEVMAVLAEMGVAADLEHVRDAEQIAAYKVTATPAVTVNGKVVCAGRTPSRAEIRNWLDETGNNRQPGGKMETPVLIKNIPFSEPHDLARLVDYEEGRVVSRTFAQNPSVSLTLFAFDTGEGVSTHTAPGDAMVQVLDGEAVVNIDGKEMTVQAGQVVVMPADIPHSVTAAKRFKMLLSVVKKPVGIAPLS